MEPGGRGQGAQRRVEFDPARLDTAFHANPYPIYSELRAHAPLHRCPDGALFLTRHADLDAVYRNRTHFSSDKEAAFGPKFGPESPLFAHHTTSLVFRDPPYHTRVRRQIVGALTPAAIRGIADGLERLVDRLCGRMAAKGEVDLIADFAAAIPVEVIGNLLGVPAEAREPLRDWSLAILGALDPAPSAEALALGNRSVSEFLDFTAQLIAARRAGPRGDADLLTRLITDASGGEPLTDAELQHNCIFLLNAGHETTTNLIGNALALLLAAPAAAEDLRRHPQIIGSAVEEFLRLESPNQLGNRLVVEPIEIGGERLEAGTYLTLCIGAANRDPAVFAEPDRMDLRREPNRHLAFGAGGHACAGMSVARLEATLALNAFLARFPHARLVPGARRSERARFRGYAALPAELA